MTKKELIMSTLEKMGYNPEIDGDGDIKFHYQMKALYVLTGDDEESYLSILLPQFYEIENDNEMLALAVCNKMTREMKLLKVYIDQTFQNISASCEFFYASKKSLEQNIKHSLKIMGVVRTIFRKDMEELSEE